MREHTIRLYTFDELSDEAKKRAIEEYRTLYAHEDHGTGYEVISSLKGVFDTLGIKIKDYSIGGYRNHNKVKIDLSDDVAALHGARAIAWFENNLFASLRITRREYLSSRKDYIRYGREYRIGHIKPCPFTGMCWDDDLLDCIRTDLKGGMTIGDILKHSLPDKCGELLESDYEWRNSDEYIAETLTLNDYEFTENGHLY